jgi:hypothetical protein
MTLKLIDVNYVVELLYVTMEIEDHDVLNVEGEKYANIKN